MKLTKGTGTMIHSSKTCFGILVSLSILFFGCDVTSTVGPKSASVGGTTAPNPPGGNACAVGCDFIYGIEEGSGEIYKIFLNNLAVTSDNEAVPAFAPEIQTPREAFGPNSLALDVTAGRLYFTNWQQDGADPLYSIDVSTSEQQLAGFLGLYFFNATATFFGDAYYYTPQLTGDDLYAVTFSNGTIAANDVVCSNFTGADAADLIYGDYAHRGGVIYGNARFVGSGNSATYFTLNPSSCDYVRLTPETRLLQLAFECNGSLIGHETRTGEFFLVDRDTGVLSSLGTIEMDGHVLKFNDLAPSGSCCEITEDCITVKFLGATTNADGTHTFKYEVTSDCNRGLSFIAFELPEGVKAINPSTTAPLGKIENPGGTKGRVNPPYRNLKFELSGDFKGGDVATFSYTLPKGAEYDGQIRIRTKSAREIIDITLTSDICPLINN